MDETRQRQETGGEDAEERDTNIEKYSQWALALQN